MEGKDNNLLPVWWKTRQRGWKSVVVQRKGECHYVEGLADMSSVGCNKIFTFITDPVRKGASHKKLRKASIERRVIRLR